MRIFSFITLKVFLCCSLFIIVSDEKCSAISLFLHIQCLFSLVGFEVFSLPFVLSSLIIKCLHVGFFCLFVSCTWDSLSFLGLWVYSFIKFEGFWPFFSLIPSFSSLIETQIKWGCTRFHWNSASFIFFSLFTVFFSFWTVAVAMHSSLLILCKFKSTVNPIQCIIHVRNGVFLIIRNLVWEFCLYIPHVYLYSTIPVASWTCGINI